ncbi:hypothetical protein SAMN06265220_1011188 [Flavobacterium nitrogenifigens]|uniref:Uncharacterized protein n=1 Tax=Flavobacterium nitrogenifigens TaxID=1617283 RepID=A0A521BP78_9FLAO|nr:hypothetical protein SAMN06265220_1011188 [Flavobacterium nitrogenifigens]
MNLEKEVNFSDLLGFNHLLFYIYRTKTKNNVKIQFF